MHGKLFTLAGVVALAGASSALGAQSATADGLAYRLIVPGLAFDSGPVATAAVQAGHLSSTNDGGLVVTGDVSNTSLNSITNVHVRVSAVVGDSTVTRETTTLVDAIGPGGRAPFRVVFALPGDTSGPVTAEVVSFDTVAAAPSATFAFAGPYPFQVGPPDAKTGAIPYSTVLDQLRGQVTNTSGQTLSGIGIVVAIYDGIGNVAWVGNGAELQAPFQEAGDEPVLLAGQTGSFIVGLPKGLLNTVPGQATFAGFVNATLD
jgi:hypothetical protein